MVTELPLATGRRADVVAVSPAGEIWIVEIKSSIEDFRVDAKWPDYRLSCDRLLFATHDGVPLEIFPEDAGLSFNTAPAYYDYQLLTTWAPDANKKLRILWYGSLDRLKLLFESNAVDEEKLRIAWIYAMPGYTPELIGDFIRDDYGAVSTTYMLNNIVQGLTYYYSLIPSLTK